MSVVDCLPSMCKILDFYPKQMMKREEEVREGRWRGDRREGREG